MEVQRTPIAGCLVVRSPRIEDRRGWFRETWRLDRLEAALGYAPRFRQNNHSRSAARVLRGFHVEPWHKLVHVVRGTALVAVADLRRDGPTRPSSSRASP